MEKIDFDALAKLLFQAAEIKQELKEGITDRERELMLHALGSSSPKTALGWRNYFCTEDGDPEWESLVDRGLASSGKTINDGTDRYYCVTALGCELLGVTLR